MSRFRVLAAGMGLAAVVVLTAALPASAHDELVASTPTDGEQLAAAPTAIELDYSAEVLDVGALVIVADADDHDWVAGPAVVSGTSVSVPLTENMPDGGYEVRWRVVSSDGHPISGVIPFAVGDAEPLVRTAVPSASPSEAASTAAPDAAGTDTAASEDGGVVRVVLIGLGGAIVATAVLLIIHLLRRRDPADDADGPRP
ncbi:copper resistance CopC family protein [Microbacterium sp. NPDC089189]|uniref:copper resistance CopC family protein n=1 Tax=Microbacterium sp. NPDC089189 TaxID=3154972 RepID=UPI0034330AE3